MRIIEPHRLQNKIEKSHVKSRVNIKKKLLGFLLITALSVSSLYYFSEQNTVDVSSQPTQESTEQTVTEQEDVINTGFRQFSGNEFRLLYENTLLPNTERVELPPAITGNDIADGRIRKIAESRGYKLRRNPTERLSNVDGYPMQDLVHQPWLELKKEAASAGIVMSIVSGYRSVEDQRQLFLNGLSAEGVTTAEIEAGTADEQINTVLITTAVPGYSRHHTGYVFDLLCAGWIFENFKNTECHDWLVANNYEKAKKYGFIPSYPDDADLQGPEPEAWEYIYVGADLLLY